VKKKNVEKDPINSAGFCGGGQGLSWAVETRKEERYPKLLNGFQLILVLRVYIGTCRKI
jgi:hypothetical protein